MRISDWSSDVCSSDLNPSNSQLTGTIPSVGWRQFEFSARNNFIAGGRTELEIEFQRLESIFYSNFFALVQHQHFIDRKSVVLGKSVSLRVDLGGRSIIKKKNVSNLNLRYFLFIIIYKSQI